MCNQKKRKKRKKIRNLKDLKLNGNTHNCSVLINISGKQAFINSFEAFWQWKLNAFSSGDGNKVNKPFNYALNTITKISYSTVQSLAWPSLSKFLVLNLFQISAFQALGTFRK